MIRGNSVAFLPTKENVTIKEDIMLSINLSGHLAVVTGGTGQLGRVMVRTIAACGAGVVIHYHQDVEIARRLLSEVRAAGLPGMVVQADVTVEQDVQSMASRLALHLRACWHRLASKPGFVGKSFDRKLGLSPTKKPVIDAMVHFPAAQRSFGQVAEPSQTNNWLARLWESSVDKDVSRDASSLVRCAPALPLDEDKRS